MTRPPRPDISDLEPWRTTYVSHGLELAGYLFRPAGAGPYPAVLVNHGSGGLRPRMRQVAETLTGLGYVVFMPTRRGYHDNPGKHWQEWRRAPEGLPEWQQQVVDSLQAENDDVLVALEWLRGQPDVDPRRLAVMGISYGGIMTMLAAGRTNRFQAAVNFAGAAMSWEGNPKLAATLLAAARRTEIPIFLIQARNDYSLAPTYYLGLELFNHGKPHETRIYPPHGVTRDDGHAFFSAQPDVWRDDVNRFLQTWLR